MLAIMISDLGRFLVLFSNFITLGRKIMYDAALQGHILAGAQFFYSYNTKTVRENLYTEDIIIRDHWFSC